MNSLKEASSKTTASDVCWSLNLAIPAAKNRHRMIAILQRSETNLNFKKQSWSFHCTAFKSHAIHKKSAKMSTPKQMEFSHFLAD